MQLQQEIRKCHECVCFVRSRRVCALAWWLKKVAPSKIPEPIESRAKHCPPKAMVCRWFAESQFTVSQLEKGMPTPRQLMEGKSQIWNCPLPLCYGTLDVSKRGYGRCAVCGSKIQQRKGQVLVHTRPKDVIPARVERIVGFLPDELKYWRNVQPKRRSIFLGPDYEIVSITDRGVTIAPKGSSDRRRRQHYGWRALRTLLVQDGELSITDKAALSEHKTIIVEYSLPQPLHYLDRDEKLTKAVTDARDDPVWLFNFNLALAISQMVRTVEVMAACGASMEEITNVVFTQLDTLVHGLRELDKKPLTRKTYRQCEGRMSLVRETYMREKLRLTLKGMIGTVGRSAGRKVEVEAGEPRSAAQSCWDAAKNSFHRTLRLWLRTTTANSGFGWRAPWLFNHRLAELGLHLDLEEVPKMMSDALLIEWFTGKQLQEGEFITGRDKYLMPTYTPTPEGRSWIRDQVVHLLENRKIWYNGTWYSIIDVHQRRLESLKEALLAVNPTRHIPLMYLPVLPDSKRKLLQEIAEEIPYRLKTSPFHQVFVDQTLKEWGRWIEG